MVILSVLHLTEVAPIVREKYLVAVSASTAALFSVMALASYRVFILIECEISISGAVNIVVLECLFTNPNLWGLT